MEERRTGEDRRSSMQEMADDIRQIKEILLGNGKIGICGKVQVMWNTTLFIFIGLAGIIGAWMWEQLLK